MIYFDNAATSFPKPKSVIFEVENCLRSYCGNPGRGAHYLSRKAAEKIYETRECIADFFGLPSPENVFFTYNDTYALNMVIKGLIESGDHIIISDMEHNSVYRPVSMLAERGIAEYDVFNSLCLSSERTPERICAGIKALIKDNTKMLVTTHASNICSAELPLREIGALCREEGIIFVVDGAQSAGHIDINMEEMNIDVLCVPGHKGLYGIQGCGFALLRDGILPSPIIEGGSGVNSLMRQMPELSPERFEAGTTALPSIAALCSGIKFVREQGIHEIHQRECALYCRLRDMLASLDGITHYAEQHIGATLLFNVNGIPCERVADILDRRGICVRSGFHCSPLAHGTIGTINKGAVRVSFSPFNTMRELDLFYSVIKEMMTSGV